MKELNHSPVDFFLLLVIKGTAEMELPLFLQRYTFLSGIHIKVAESFHKRVPELILKLWH